MAFSVGAVLPLLPYLIGAAGLLAAMVITAVALVVGGMVVGRLTGRPLVRLRRAATGAGGAAVAVTFMVGRLIGAAS